MGLYEMMPMYKPGDRPYADHLNLLSEIAREVSSLIPGSYMYGREGTPGHSDPPFLQRPAQIVKEDWPLGKVNGTDGYYEIRFRYFDRDGTESWQVDQSGFTAFLDASVTEDTFSEGDKIIVFWNPQKGMWIRVGGGSGSAGLVRFSVVEKISDDPYGVCICEILSTPCKGSTIPGMTADGLIIVYDFSNCYFDEPAEFLPGRQGWATYMKPSELVSGSGPEIGSGVDNNICVWEVLGLCCPGSTGGSGGGGSEDDEESSSSSSSSSSNSSSSSSRSAFTG